MRFRPTWTPRATRPSISSSRLAGLSTTPAGHDALHVGAEDAAGDQRELEGLAAGDDGMAGIGPALVADDDIVLLG